MKIALHSNQVTNSTLAIITKILELAATYKIEIVASSKLVALLRDEKKIPQIHPFSSQYLPTSLKLFISIGGDGTLLEAASYINHTAIPLLGVNTGNLGFLATISRDGIAMALENFLKGNYTLDKRTMLSVYKEGSLVGFALNEIALLRRDTSSMITVNAYIDDVLINTYWADGLMVTTPTGSTGYSLSCGGPIVLPSTNSWVITPVSPHNLSVRPLIVPDTTTLKFVVTRSNQHVLVALDGRSAAMPTASELTIKKADFILNLVNVGSTTIFDILRQKLHWGVDSRN